jgi:hypothetical protein
MIFVMRQGSVVGVVTPLRAGRSRGLNLGRGNRFFSLLKRPFGPEAYTVSITVDNGCDFSKGKAAGV